MTDNELVFPGDPKHTKAWERIRSVVVSHMDEIVATCEAGDIPVVVAMDRALGSVESEAARLFGRRGSESVFAMTPRARAVAKKTWDPLSIAWLERRYAVRVMVMIDQANFLLSYDESEDRWRSEATDDQTAKVAN